MPTLEDVKRELARKKLSQFLMYDSDNRWLPAKHLLLLCEKLEAVERGELLRLMVFTHPRAGKSEVISKKFPAWYFGKHPDNEIIMTSYAADLALDHSRIARDTFKEHGQRLWGLSLSKDSGSAERWTIAKHRGGLSAAGVGGAQTGRGAHVALIDDPVKNAEEAESLVIRDKVWEWYRTTLRTRLAPGGAIILVMTRWHENDLAGRLVEEMKSGGEQWEIVNLPAQAEENDVLGRQPGEWLWPERYPPEEYEAIKIAVGSRHWNSLYQQRPSPEEGGMIKRHWWKFYTELPKQFDRILQSWDMTFKDSDGSDYVSGQVWGNVGASIYMIPDREYGRMDFTSTLEAFLRLTNRNPKATIKLVEDKANGPAVISMLRLKTGGIIAINPKGSKIARVSAVSPLIEAGNVYLPAPSICPWVNDFIEECSSFPNGVHDDQIDAASQALSRFMYARDAVPTEQKDPFLHRGEQLYDSYRGGEPDNTFVNYGS
jgi:predicted phage terminase large subunit-like protein